MTIEIPFLPRPKQSFRYSKTGRKYTPADVAENQQSIALYLGPHRPDKPMAGPVSLRLEFHFPWRKGDSLRTRAKGEVPHDTKPDCDNLAKQVCDVLEAMGFFLCDSQIAELTVIKKRSDLGPRTYIALERIEP